jgi:hypothetical protein
MAENESDSTPPIPDQIALSASAHTPRVVLTMAQGAPQQANATTQAVTPTPQMAAQQTPQQASAQGGNK